MTDARDFAGNLETAVNILAIGAFVASERVAADNRVRREILQQNAGVAAGSAQRAARREAQLQLGRDLQQRFLESRRAN
jgi:hypothetical protein